MKIIDTAEQVEREFFGQPFDLEKWRAYAAGISPELARMCLMDIEKYDFDRQAAPVLRASLSRPGTLRELHASFLRAVDYHRAVPGAVLRSRVGYPAGGRACHPAGGGEDHRAGLVRRDCHEGPAVPRAGPSVA